MTAPFARRPARSFPRLFAWGDLLVFLALVAILVRSVPGARQATPNATVVIYSGAVIDKKFPLSDSLEVIVGGAHGPITISIGKGTVRVVEATCPNQICVRSGAIAHSGQQLICAPNAVMVEIVEERSRAGGVDAVTR